MKSWKKIYAAVCLLVLSFLLCAEPAQAALTSGKTSTAITRYAAFIRKQSGGARSYTKAPGYTGGDLSAYRKILKKYISDGKPASRAYGSGRLFSTAKEALIYMWSLNYKNNPYVDYEVYVNRKKGEGWYGYVLDNQENALKYKSDKSGKGGTAAKKFKADFRKQLSAYQKKKGKLTQAGKVAAAANYVAQKLSYGYGGLVYKDEIYWAGGDLYTAWVTGYGSCVDYSCLLHLILKDNGIESHLVMGRVREMDDSEWAYHQWNLVKIGKKYYYIDATWSDCGANTGFRDSDHYFAAGPDSLYYDWEIYIII